LRPAAVDAPKRQKSMSAKNQRVLPGFGLALGYTLVYLSLLILLPLAGMILKTAELGWGQVIDIALGERSLAAFRITFTASLLAASINALFGLIVAWILVRYPFPGKRFVDALVDLPFALPTAVAGITLATLYAGNGWLGRFIEPLGFKVAYTPVGIVVALTFVTLPFVVRTLQPVIEDIEPEVEEAAATLGASRWQTFTRIIFPAIFPALLTGFALAFARAIGEFGSVIFIAGNIPLVSEIVPLLIISKLEQYDVLGATALAVVMLAISFVMLLGINGLQWWAANRHRNREPLEVAAGKAKGGKA
jgi:sulfate/thiosulfate transport system permease protein